MGKQSKAKKGNGNTKTKKQARDEILTLDLPVSKSYLCAHICFCADLDIGKSKKTKKAKTNKTKKGIKKDKRGKNLRQQTCSKAIQAQEEINFLVWKYKAEVGYLMTTTPPMPIMSAEEPLRPSRMPLAHAPGLHKKHVNPNSILKKGLFRIPDCIILNISVDDLIVLRAYGTYTYARLATKLIPIQRNIERVVEIKFGKDGLSPEQIKHYRTIAGDRNKFQKVYDTDCDCKDDDDDRKRQRQSEYQRKKDLGREYTYRPVTIFETPQTLSQRHFESAKFKSPVTLALQNPGSSSVQKPSYVKMYFEGVALGAFIVGAIALAPEGLLFAGASGVTWHAATN